jgi:hypothetical protein
MKLRTAALLPFGFVLFAVGACGSEELGDAYTGASDRTVVVGDGKRAVFVTPDGQDCIQVGTSCVKPQDKCGEGARADVIVDSKGNVVEIVCYPPLAEGTPPKDAQGDVDLAKENGGVVTLDGTADGADITGNVSANGNNVTVYGQGAGLSVIGGSVTAGGNNFSMRGTTVQKDVTINGNNGTLVLSDVLGDVTVNGNNVVIAECTIFGKLVINGNNAKLVANRVAGGITIEGKETLCESNVAFSDANGDKVVTSNELGAALTCNGAQGGKK